MPNLGCSFFLWIALSFTFCCDGQLSVQTNIKGHRGSGVALTCVVPDLSVGPPTITWEKETDSGSVTVAFSVSEVSHISGPLEGRASLSGANLTISLLKISDSGKYTCKVLRAALGAQSASTNLIVTAVPNVTASAIELPRVEGNGKYAAASCQANNGEPKAEMEWINKDGLVQDRRESSSLNEDGSWNVELLLLLEPGVLGRPSNSTLPVSDNEKRQTFTCRVMHEDLITEGQRTRAVAIDLLYSPLAYISLIGNRLTCHVEGNPSPSITWYLPNGKVIRGEKDIYIGQIASENGRYSCLANNILQPDAISTLQVERARDLPTLFRTLVELHTSLPATALGYEIECSAEIEESLTGTQSLYFQWTRNFEELTDDSYQVVSKVNQQGSTATISSTLRFSNVVQGRDDASFQCRLLNTTGVTGFITAVERTVLLSIDYAPTGVVIVGQPNDFIVLEDRVLTLQCQAESKPSSVYEWHFNDEKIAVGRILTIAEMSRSQAGSYRCVAYNYVPGSSHADVSVTVQYPPSDVIITELPSFRLSCLARTGSVPPPVYTWIFPNKTFSRGNLSIIQLVPYVVDRPTTYTCMVSNNLKQSANATFVQLPPVAGRIGALSVTEFVITMVICAIIGIMLAVFAFWLFYRRRKIQSSKSISAEKTFKRYLQYSEPPESGAINSRGTRRKISEGSGRATDSPRLRNDNFRSGTRNQHQLQNKECRENNSTDHRNTKEIDNTIFVQTPPKRSLLPQEPSSQKQLQNFNEVDGSKVDIVENNPMHPPTYKPTPDDTRHEKRKVTLKSPSKHGEVTSNLEAGDQAEFSRGATLPCPTRLAQIRRDVATHQQTRAFFPVGYFPQGTVPRNFQSNIPMHIHHQHPVGLVIPGYDPILYDDTWRPGLSSYPSQENQTKSNTRQEPSTTSESTSACTESSVNYLHGSKTSRRRSMSLSASSTESLSTSYLTSSASTQQGKKDKQLLHNQIPLQQFSKRTASPFDSGNDSTKSALATKKQQSLTLV